MPRPHSSPMTVLSLVAGLLLLALPARADVPAPSAPEETHEEDTPGEP